MLNQPDLSIAATLAQFAHDLHDLDGGVEQVVSAVVDFAAKTLACSFAATVLTRRAGRLELAAVSSPLIDDLCRLTLTPGRALEAVARGGDSIVVDYWDDSELPPAEASSAALVGVRAAAHLPLKVTAGSLGALSLYSAGPIDRTSRTFAVAELVAQHASIAISAARDRDSLTEAVEARKLVGEAVGIMMQRYGIDADTAFQVLDRHSQHTNIKLRQIAHYVREFRELPPVQT